MTPQRHAEGNAEWKRPPVRLRALLLAYAVNLVFGNQASQRAGSTSGCGGICCRTRCVSARSMRVVSSSVRAPFRTGMTTETRGLYEV